MDTKLQKYIIYILLIFIALIISESHATEGIILDIHDQAIDSAMIIIQSDPPETIYTDNSGVFHYPEPNSIPTLSEWGMIVMALLILSILTITVIRRSQAVGWRGIDKTIMFLKSKNGFVKLMLLICAFWAIAFSYATNGSVKEPGLILDNEVYRMLANYPDFVPMETNLFTELENNTYRMVPFAFGPDTLDGSVEDYVAIWRTNQYYQIQPNLIIELNAPPGNVYIDDTFNSNDIATLQQYLPGATQIATLRFDGTSFKDSAHVANNTHVVDVYNYPYPDEDSVNVFHAMRDPNLVGPGANWYVTQTLPDGTIRIVASENAYRPNSFNEVAIWEEVIDSYHGYEQEISETLPGRPGFSFFDLHDYTPNGPTRFDSLSIMLNLAKPQGNLIDSSGGQWIDVDPSATGLRIKYNINNLLGKRQRHTSIAGRADLNLIMDKNVSPELEHKLKGMYSSMFFKN